jgi:hypothetical protein
MATLVSRERVVQYRPPSSSEWQSVVRMREKLKPYLPELEAKFRELERRYKSSDVYAHFVGVMAQKGFGRFEAFALLQYFRFKKELLKSERYDLQRAYLESIGEDVEEGLRWLNAYRLAAYRASHR